MMFRISEILVLMVVVAAIPRTMSSRDIRSPGGRDWQQGGRFGGGPSVGVARSSHSGWSGSGIGVGQSYGARPEWSATSGYGLNGRNSGSNYPSSNGWTNGPRENTGYGRNSYNTNGGWTGSNGIDSIETGNGWDGSRMGNPSNNGWQSRW